MHMDIILPTASVLLYTLYFSEKAQVAKLHFPKMHFNIF